MGMLGQPGKGVRTIVEMVVHTRLDCIIGSAALMRLSAQHAVQHAGGRTVLGRQLIEQPLMRAVLADLALESEAAVATWLRLSKALDSAPTSPSDAAFMRLATAVSKYYVCKRAPLVVYEAMECHGGNGYVEEGPMPRLFRQSPLNAIWEGSGNVICLDVVRALTREPASGVALLQELEDAISLAEVAASEFGQGNCYGGTVEYLRRQLSLPPSQLELKARSIVDQMAVCLQAATLLKHGDEIVAKCFVTTRLPAKGNTLVGHSLGAMGSTLPEAAAQHLIERLIVHIDGEQDESGPLARL